MKKYPCLDVLFGVYFSQDSDLFGDTTQEIMASYCKNESGLMRKYLRNEISEFIDDFLDVDAELECRYPMEWDSKKMEPPAKIFLKEILNLLN